MAQTRFEFNAAPHQRHSETSKAAAVEVTPRLGILQIAVLKFIASHPDGLTDEQIAEGLGMNPSTARPRRIELQAQGKIVESGKRETRAGRMAVVWKIRQ